MREDGAVRFVQLPAPSDEEVKLVLQRIASRLRKLLRPRADAAKDDARPLDALGAAQAESVTFLLGKPADAAVIKRQAAYLEGFSLHAGVRLHANDREGLARLCGYGARSPTAAACCRHLAPSLSRPRRSRCLTSQPRLRQCPRPPTWKAAHPRASHARPAREFPGPSFLSPTSASLE